MPIVTSIAAFLTIWCVALFVVLPLGVEREENPDPGWDPGAPRRHRIGLKLAGSFALTVVLFAVWRFVAHWQGWP